MLYTQITGIYFGIYALGCREMSFVTNHRVEPGIKGLFSHLPLFEGLSEQDMNILVKAARESTYKKGEYLYHQGERAYCLSVITDGWIRLYRGNVEGDEGSIRLYTRGDVLGERAVLPGNLKHFFSAQIISDTSVINIPERVIKEVARRNSSILNKVILGLMEKMDEIHVEQEHMVFLNAPQRVACLLLRLSANMVGNGGTFTFPYDKSLAAAQLGMKRETFSRALACLKRQGVHTKGSEIKIENFVRLSEFCCMSCSLNAECRGVRCTTQVCHSAIKGVSRGHESFF